MRRLIVFSFAISILVPACGAGERSLLNASFDISRELFQAYNPVFVAHWRAEGGSPLTINQSHAGSSKQARAVIDGLEADVVTFNQVTDVDAIAARGLIAATWRGRLPHNSVPFTSTIVFLTRQGNPKAVHDWDDLVKPGISVVVPSPKTSGNGRYGYLAAYSFARKKFGGDDLKAREFVTALFRNVPVFDTGGRGASTSFIQRKIGDVLVTFEAEVLLTLKEYGAGEFQQVTPSSSIVADMPVAVVDRVANRRGTVKEATAYLEYLFSEAGQELAAKHHYRPSLGSIARKYAERFPTLELISVDQAFGGWENAQKAHFADGGSFDQVLAAIRTR
ncbi:MAG TPA: sulfate ABC transporter substrate-binding protein [Verrucomicrobiota bacterium]|nr:hypothetical protein [Verrucomicrobiales bacterium]HRI12743.1 sulfate ABC transporter substrate-binding protein [Verrucomicrobiota bacterium]